MTTAVIRDRVKELRRVRASELTPHAKNWRAHPKAQQQALMVMFEEVGFAGAVLAYEDGGELVLIDGHLRADTLPEQMIPVLVLDVNEDEAEKLLATWDPIGAMAEADMEALQDLMADIGQDGSEDLAAVLALAESRMSPMPLGSGDPAADDDASDPEPQVNPEGPGGKKPKGEGEFYVITFRMSRKEYDEKQDVIAAFVDEIQVTPHISEV